MKEIFLNCDSPCFTCPIYDRMIRISHFNQRKLHESFYCHICDIYSLCKLGLAYKKAPNGDLKPSCTKCGNFVDRIELSYQEGQNYRPFSVNSLLVIRKENGNKFDILQTLKGSYFKDLAEVLLYILYQFGPNNYNVINYDIITKNYNTIFSGDIEEEKVAVKSDKPTSFYPVITFT